ncbi:hypothetical protein GOV14_02805 [Candidatus Pacearchaeota archaeon]|nr:hypothetical protein [Candidatus Pacearchaeota archaeon]
MRVYRIREESLMGDYDAVGEVAYEAMAKEVSSHPGWYDLPKDGGGDIDLADY